MVQMAKGGPKTEEKRAEILRNAADVFRRKGFAGAGMREIAQGLGMAPGALYYYFESKEDLLYSCQLLTLQRLIRSGTQIAASNAAPADKVRELVRAHLRHSLGELGGRFAHVEFHALPAERLAEVVAERDRYEACWRAIVREFDAAGAKLKTLTCLGALNWAAVWWRPDGEYDLEEVADAMADTLLKGLDR
ncbi:MAG: TetR family transcriptional regulator [Planctomycetota bacterium]|jgi:AcrR family transcriptional regulator